MAIDMVGVVVLVGLLLSMVLVVLEEVVLVVVVRRAVQRPPPLNLDPLTLAVVAVDGGKVTDPLLMIFTAGMVVVVL
jgi:hypothetical protein